MRKTQTLRQSIALFLALFFMSVTCLNALPSTTSAQSTSTESFISQDYEYKVKDVNKYLFLRYCFHYYYDKDYDLSQNDVENWDFFHQPGGGAFDDYRQQFAIIGNIYGANKDATWSCNEEDNVETAFEALGFNDSKRVFCALDGSYLKKKNTFGDDKWYGDDDCYSREVDGDKAWDNDEGGSKMRESFESLVKTAKANVTGSGQKAFVAQTLPEDVEYVRYYLSFMNQCGVGTDRVEILGKYQAGDADPDDKYQLPVVSQTGEVTDYLASGQVSGGSQVAMWATVTDTEEYKQGDGEGASNVDYDLWPRGRIISCNEAIERIRDTAPKYAAYVKANQGKLTGSTTEDTNTTTNEPDPTCESESGSLGWLFCGILGIMDGAIDFLDQTINNLLFINSDTYDNNGIKDAWAIMRNIALLLLVPMMIFMVIGTALNFGPFDPYTVKKALPRMFVATIFIVISLPITTFAVQLSNTVGQGLGNLIVSAAPSDVNSLRDVFASSGSSTSGETGLFTGAVVGAAVAGVAGVLTLGIFGSFAIVTIVALLIGFVILVMRQVLIVMLMVIAPIAILVWIFPGNDKLWGIWKTTFIAMLMMYPIISMLLASGRFVAGIVSF